MCRCMCSLEGLFDTLPRALSRAYWYRWWVYHKHQPYLAFPQDDRHHCLFECQYSLLLFLADRELFLLVGTWHYYSVPYPNLSSYSQLRHPSPARSTRCLLEPLRRNWGVMYSWAVSTEYLRSGLERGGTWVPVSWYGIFIWYE